MQVFLVFIFLGFSAFGSKQIYRMIITSLFGSSLFFLENF